MIKVYVAGPITLGVRADNIKSAIDATNRLMDAGFAVFCPHLSHYLDLERPRTHAEWLAHDMEWLPLCDCLLRLPGESKGADQEVEAARQDGMPVFCSIPELMRHYGAPQRRM